MFQALALSSIGSRKYKVHANATDEFILRRGRGKKHPSEQLSVGAEGNVDAPDQGIEIHRAVQPIAQPRQPRPPSQAAAAKAGEQLVLVPSA